MGEKNGCGQKAGRSPAKMLHGQPTIKFKSNFIEGVSNFAFVDSAQKATSNA